MTREEELNLAFNDLCPDCRGKLEWGPRGPLCQNAACLQCRNRYNVSPISVERHGKVYIDSNGKVCW